MKEFWISKCKHVGVPTYVSDKVHFELRKQHQEIQDCCEVTHVIEQSALEAAQKEIECLTKLVTSWDQQNKIEMLESKLDKAVEALKEIEDYHEVTGACEIAAKALKEIE